MSLKRTPLARKTPLARRHRIRVHRKPKPIEPGQIEFKLVRHGICRVCHVVGLVRRHHIIYEQVVRREGGDPWDPRNGMWVGIEGMTCDCHERQHNASQRIPESLLSVAAREFAVELLGEDRAADYLRRLYA